MSSVTSNSTDIDTVCFLSILPLEKLFEYCGEQLTFYVGKDFGELIIVTLAKYVGICNTFFQYSCCCQCRGSDPRNHPVDKVPVRIRLTVGNLNIIRPLP